MLEFTYGTMGSSKTAQALIKKFNLEEKGFSVILIKPATDTRDGANTVKSRIGISAEAITFRPQDNILEYAINPKLCSATYIVADEAQFFTEAQIESLKTLADNGCNVYCYGILTDFKTKMFPAARRLVELADQIHEIETKCPCGNKASVNARIGNNGEILRDGQTVELGGNDRYEPMCYNCWKHRTTGFKYTNEKGKELC